MIRLTHGPFWWKHFSMEVPASLMTIVCDIWQKAGNWSGEHCSPQAVPEQVVNYLCHFERPRKAGAASILQDDTELSDTPGQELLFFDIWGHRYLQYKLEEISCGTSINAKSFIVTIKHGFVHLLSNKNVTFPINAEGSPQLYHAF